MFFAVKMNQDPGQWWMEYGYKFCDGWARIVLCMLHSSLWYIKRQFSIYNPIQCNKSPIVGFIHLAPNLIEINREKAIFFVEKNLIILNFRRNHLLLLEDCSWAHKLIVPEPFGCSRQACRKRDGTIDLQHRRLQFLSPISWCHRIIC